MGKGGFFGKLTRCAALALVFGAVGGTAFSGANYFISSRTGEEASSDTENSGAISSEKIQATSTVATVKSTDVSEVVENVMPSIVAITSMSQQEVMDFFGRDWGQSYESESSGSGIIVGEDDASLYIATNNHVVEGSTALTVQFSDDTTASATLRGTDSADDLAVVQVALSDLTEETRNTVKVAEMGDSDTLSVGDAAIAIGNALGYGQSVTTGVISALDREVALQDETTGQTISSKLIQTDAAINPGNSGGALLNTEGEVIGINSSKYSDTSVEGMGFAIPISTAKPIIEDLIANGKTTTTGSPYLGIYGVDVTEDVANQYNMPQGVYVAQVVQGSGAEAAGITAGTIITKVDGTEVTSMDELKSTINEYQVGDTVTITIKVADNGNYVEREVSVTLSSQQNN